MAGKGSAPGERRGGRTKGVPNKATVAIQHRGNELVIMASERIRQILEGKVPCSVCRGKGRTKFQPRGPDGSTAERACQSCWGSKYEQLSPELVGKVALALREEAYPKLKAVEHSNPDGSLKPVWTVIMPPGIPKP